MALATLFWQKRQVQHPNVVQFKAICFAPTVVMLEYFGSVENAECGVRSAECGKCGVWKMRGVENAECGKCGVWKMRGVENAECGKCGVWKMSRKFQFSISI